jgi:hypothetical protein
MTKAKKEVRYYSPVPGSRLRADDAEKIGREVDDITDCGNRPIPDADLPSRLLDRARSKTSEIHHLFEWDDAAAADAHRRERANYLIRSVRIEIRTIKNEVLRVPLLIRELPTENGKKVTLGFEQAMADPQHRATMVDRALSELQSVRRRYTEIKELADVFDKIDEASERLAG